LLTGAFGAEPASIPIPQDKASADASCYFSCFTTFIQLNTRVT